MLAKVGSVLVTRNIHNRPKPHQEGHLGYVGNTFSSMLPNCIEVLALFASLSQLSLLQDQQCLLDSEAN